MFLQEDFIELVPCHVQSVPQVNTISPLPHEPVFSNDATVDIPLGGAKVSFHVVISCLAFFVYCSSFRCFNSRLPP